MGTKVFCSITGCKYHFDGECTRGELEIGPTSAQSPGMFVAYVSCLDVEYDILKSKAFLENFDVTNRWPV